MSTLRGAGVAVDVRRAGQVAVGICLVSLAVASGLLFAAGADKNAQISALRSHGVQVVVTVTTCNGLLGGSGSNPVGYACRGTYSIGGHHYDEYVPGNTLRAPGSTLRGVTVTGEPGLLSTAADVAAEHPSWTVFVVPTVLLVVLVLLVGAIALRRRHTRRIPPGLPALAAGRAEGG